MKKFKIFFIFLVLFISVSAVYADGNFTDLQMEINDAENSIEITQNYIYDNSTDYQLNQGIYVNKSNFTINGNGYTVDGAGQARIFAIEGQNVTLLNLKLINAFNVDRGGAILASDIICKNVTFVNNCVNSSGGAIFSSNIVLDGCEFRGNLAKDGAAVLFYGNATVEDTIFSDSRNYSSSLLYASGNGILFVNNCTFANSTSKYAPALYSNKRTIVKNSLFTNLQASLTAGAVALKTPGNSEFENCLFENTSAVNNGGAIFSDVYGEHSITSTNEIIIKDSQFLNCHADFGGAIVQLGGNLTVLDSLFLENQALYDGAAIYLSYTNSLFDNVSVVSNDLIYTELFDGGIYCDQSSVSIVNSYFANNTKNAIYAYDSYLNIENTTFSNNTEAIHGAFSTFELANVEVTGDTLFLNDTPYPTVVDEPGVNIPLVDNTIDVTNLPARFDSRDWGWVTPVRNQGDMGACWSFGITGAIESSILKATGISYDLSENNMQNSMLQYSKYGRKGAIEGASFIQGLEYAVSWFGVFPSDYDVYDELGKLSPLIASGENIDIFDVISVNPRSNFTDNDALKRAILKCGAISFGYGHFDEREGIENTFNYETNAYYQNVSSDMNHLVTCVGWDDNYPASNFLITPPGDGAFIVKNSWGDDWGENGYFYISYYDISAMFHAYAYGFLMVNDENYSNVYQNMIGGTYFVNNFTTAAMINFESLGNELISGVGSFFFEDGENYTIEVYVNGVLMHGETGSVDFAGYNTIKLIKEVPVKENDKFTIKLLKNGIPYAGDSRSHIEPNTTFLEYMGEWADVSEANVSIFLKVYTKDLPIFTQDLVKIYKNDSKFEANIGVANQTVTFEINGGVYNRTSDENGTAKIAINLNPGNYTIKTTFNGTTVENTITVLPTLIADNLVKYYRNASQFYISLIDGAGNPVPYVNITMNINGVFYNRTTNENGTARLNINLNPGEYILTAIDPLTGLQMSYNITVLPVLTAEDINMTYKDGTQFKVNLVDGQGNPVANVNITMNINGVFYQRTTDENGTARLNINLMPGEYIITSQYESAAISNKITIIAKED